MKLFGSYLKQNRFEMDLRMFYMENFECSTTFEYKGFVKRKISPICHMIGNILIYEIILIFLIEL